MVIIYLCASSKSHKIQENEIICEEGGGARRGCLQTFLSLHQTIIERIPSYFLSHHELPSL